MSTDNQSTEQAQKRIDQFHCDQHRIALQNKMIGIMAKLPLRAIFKDENVEPLPIDDPEYLKLAKELNEYEITNYPDLVSE